MTKTRNWLTWGWSGLALLWLALFPLWQDGTYSHITRTKWEGMQILAGISLAAAGIMLALLLFRRFRGVRGAVAIGPKCLPLWLALAFFAWMGISALCSGWLNSLNGDGMSVVWIGSRRYEGLSTQLCYLLIFLVMAVTRPSLTAVLHGAGGAVLLFAAVVVLQYAGVNVLGLYPAGRSVRTNYQFQGTIGNIDMVSGYLSLAIPLLLLGFLLLRRSGFLLASGLTGLALSACIEVDSGRLAVLALVLAVAALAAVRPGKRCRACVLLASMALVYALRSMIVLPWLNGGETVYFRVPGRFGLMMLAVAAFLAAAAALFRHRPLKAVSPKGAGLVLAALIVAAALTVALIPVPETSGALYEIHEALCGRAQDSFGNERVGVWRCTLDMIRQRPLTGYGPDTFYYALSDYLTSTGKSLTQTFDNPHNEYLAIAVNDGLPALGLYLALLVSVLAGLLRRGGDRGRILAGAVLCYAVQGVFSFSICLVAPMFWAVLGMGAAFAAREKPASVREGSGKPLKASGSNQKKQK